MYPYCTTHLYVPATHLYVPHVETLPAPLGSMPLSNKSSPTPLSDAAAQLQINHYIVLVPKWYADTWLLMLGRA
jgi:hypothetical protein